MHGHKQDNFILDHDYVTPYYGVTGNLVIPTAAFIRETPLFGVHGMKQENVEGFVRDFEGKGLAFGHFFHMTMEDRGLSPSVFALRLNACIRETVGVGLEVNVDTGNNLIFDGRPAVMVQINRPGFDLEELGGEYVEQTEVYSSRDRGLVTKKTLLFSEGHEAVSGQCTIKPFLFTEADAAMASQEWHKFIDKRRKTRLEASATEFSMAVAERILTTRILDELVREMEARRASPNLPQPKP
ncbi:MAG: hypothetical protein V1703_04885 [Candidatus Altiarchaeota archaeon]